MVENHSKRKRKRLSRAGNLRSRVQIALFASSDAILRRSGQEDMKSVLLGK
jgi:hypothetical protein